jgi:hypothetical protein
MRLAVKLISYTVSKYTFHFDSYIKTSSDRSMEGHGRFLCTCTCIHPSARKFRFLRGCIVGKMWRQGPGITSATKRRIIASVICHAGGGRLLRLDCRYVLKGKDRVGVD